MHRLPGEHEYRGTRFPGAMCADVLDKVQQLDLSGDVVVTSYPKTGTVWVKTIAAMIQDGGDGGIRRCGSILKRAPYLELWHPNEPRPRIEAICKEDHPRIIHSHLTPQFFGAASLNNSKFIIVIRNPKDELVSYYHFYRSNSLLGNFQGTWEEFFQLFVDKHLACGDFFEWYMSWLPYLDNPNVLLVRYEDLKSDLSQGIASIAEFMDKPLPMEKIQEIEDLVKLENMSQTQAIKDSTFNDKISPFIRKGKVGDWKNYFSKEQSDFVDKKYEETLAKSGIHLKFE